MPKVLFQEREMKYTLTAASTNTYPGELKFVFGRIHGKIAVSEDTQVNPFDHCRQTRAVIGVNHDIPSGIGALTGIVKFHAAI